MRIPGKIVNRIFEQGENEKPFEACGYLAGKEGSVTKYFPMTNRDRSREHFSLEPQEQFSVIRQVRNAGLELLAVYHTHPETPARPSEEDLRLAFDPEIVYLIASLVPERREIKGFKINRGQITEEELIIEGKI